MGERSVQHTQPLQQPRHLEVKYTQFRKFALASLFRPTTLIISFTGGTTTSGSGGPTKSTKGACKMRRDMINSEIAHLRDLLPLPSSTRQRLSQLQLMALVCVYVRKSNYFQQGEKPPSGIPMHHSFCDTYYATSLGWQRHIKIKPKRLSGNDLVKNLKGPEKSFLHNAISSWGFSFLGLQVFLSKRQCSSPKCFFHAQT